MDGCSLAENEYKNRPWEKRDRKHKKIDRSQYAEATAEYLTKEHWGVNQMKKSWPALSETLIFTKVKTITTRSRSRMKK